MQTKERHILGLFGGKDSAALAIYMDRNHPEIDMEYFFTDTGQELPEVYEFLDILQSQFRDRKIIRLKPKLDFYHHLKTFGYYLPNAQNRWCTDKLKIKPLEEWIKPDLEKGVRITSYVAIRFDEKYREGHQSMHKNFLVKLPLRENRIGKKEVMDLLSDIGLPKYYDWRSRSGCTFCFFQRKIEWVRLKETHPEAFEFAKQIERDSTLNTGYTFTWCERESLEELEKPERVSEIKINHEKRRQRELRKRKINPLNPDEYINDDDLFGQEKFCISCHK